jgi:hypothetical protein
MLKQSRCSRGKRKDRMKLSIVVVQVGAVKTHAVAVKMLKREKGKTG